MIKVVAGILKKNDKIMIARKREGKPLAGMWEFPGGKIEEGETPEESLVRELMEEMKIKVKVLDYVDESIYDYGDNVVSLKGYVVQIEEGEIVLSDHDKYEWVSPEEAYEYGLAPADVPLLDKYIELHKRK